MWILGLMIIAVIQLMNVRYLFVARPGLGICKQLEVWLWDFYRTLQATKNVNMNQKQDSIRNS